MFPDNTAFIRCKQNVNLLIDSDIRHVSRWFVDSKLIVNIEKCESICFGSKQPHDVFLMGKALTYQKS